MNPLLTLPIRTVITAYANLSGDTTSVDKATAADWLHARGHDANTVRAAAGATPAAQVPAPAPAAPAGRLADIEKGLEKVTEANSAHAKTFISIGDRLTDLTNAATAAAHTMGRINDRMTTLSTEVMDRLTRAESAAAKAPVIDPAAARQIIVDEVRRAWKPFEEAVQAAGAQAKVIAQATATVTAQRTALEVFGVDVKDRKGSPLMFDLYDDPTAPPVDPDHLWSERTVRLMYLAAKHGARGNVWLGGLKGAGKTMTLQQFAARTGRAFVRVNFHQHTSADEYLGATGLAQGMTKFQAADFLMGYSRPGAVVCLDEISNAHPGSLAPLNALLEPHARVSIGGQTWGRAPGVVIGACDNTTGAGDGTGRYAGTREMNSALMDRFAHKAWMTFLPRDLERKALMSRTSATQALVDHVLNAVDQCRAKVQTGEIIDPPSIRSIEAFILALEVEEVRDAWAQTIAAAQPAESAVGLEGVYTACIDPKFINKNF